MRVSSIDKMIEQLEALERVDSKSEYYKNQAIAYLKDFADHLDSKDIKTIKKSAQERQLRMGTQKIFQLIIANCGGLVNEEI